MDYANPRLGRGFSRDLPSLANFREKARSTGTAFIKNFVAAITVVANCRCRQHDARRFRSLGQCVDKIASADNPAAQNPTLLRRSPESENILACQMNYRVEPGNRFRINWLAGVPFDLC